VSSDELRHLGELCAGDGRRLDLLEVALAMSVLRRGEAIDLVPLRQHVASMAAALADLVRRRGPAPERLADVIARAYAYRGDSETYDDLQNADLARVIERRKGLPVALSILYLHIARAQGWDAEGLAFPGHPGGDRRRAPRDRPVS
jgi:regulator of sirC expression with transglutaminase-like and TPR domain